MGEDNKTIDRVDKSIATSSAETPDTSVSTVVDKIRTPERYLGSAAISFAQVHVNHTDATPEAVEYARQAIAIPAQEMTKQAQETTKQTKYLSLGSFANQLVALLGAAGMSVLEPNLMPWIFGMYAMFQFMTTVRTWIRTSHAPVITAPNATPQLPTGDKSKTP